MDKYLLRTLSGLAWQGSSSLSSVVVTFEVVGRVRGPLLVQVEEIHANICG